MDTTLWWREGVIYQIYPRSFQDTNANGLGDLPGITSRLPYLQDLGIDAIWLSPFFPTPDKDFGYDIRDYCGVDERFGTLEDFDRLVDAAHRRGIRLVLDMVLNHTSDQHPWFQDSRRSRQSPHRDWYIWRPVSRTRFGRWKAPNNWQASFGGKAWEFDPTSGEAYLHSFTREQPDLNWRNLQVRHAMLDVFRFWLERGADGFRLDVFNAYFKDARFRDNPPKLGLRAFDRQHHIHDMDQPEMMPFLQELRALLDSYPQRYAVGETYLASPEKTLGYCGDDKLHQAFSFDFTSFSSEIRAALRVFPWSPRWILKKINARERLFNAAGVLPTTVMSNHDLPRAVSRYTRGEDDRMAKIIMTLLLTLRGTPFLYQGEEIGMRELRLKRSELHDPAGKKYFPIYPGRDGCRAPMQWDDSPQAGFSTARPWLKLHPDATRRHVRAQEKDPDSLLHFTRRLIALRKAHAALRGGEFIPVLASAHVLAYLRRSEAETLLVVLHFSRRARHLTLPPGILPLICLLSSAGGATRPAAQELHLAPLEVSLWSLQQGSGQG